jgi:hypothetical protein
MNLYQQVCLVGIAFALVAFGIDASLGNTDRLVIDVIIGALNLGLFQFNANSKD